MQLAIELVALVRSESVTLGELEHDLDRLGILLYADIDEPIAGPLDQRALLEIFGRIISEQKRPESLEAGQRTECPRLTLHKHN